MRLLFMGTGTSNGVPSVGCTCTVCTSSDPRNQRTRSSLLVQSGDRNILIDTGPELRMQCLQHGVTRLDAVLFTHTHADHIFGFDDLRRFNQLQGESIPAYGTEETVNNIRRIFSYVFRESESESSKPLVETHVISGDFEVLGLRCTTVPVLHGKLPVTGYRFGRAAYVTDVSNIPSASLDLLRGLDVLILGALRYRPHPTHFSLAEGVEVIEELQPRRALFTHLSHDVDHAQAEADLPPHIGLAYDGLVLDVVDEPRSPLDKTFVR